MKYTKASAEVVLFDNSDVITTSTSPCGVASSSGELDDCQSGASQAGVACGAGWQAWG